MIRQVNIFCHMSSKVIFTDGQITPNTVIRPYSILIPCIILSLLLTAWHHYGRVGMFCQDTIWFYFIIWRGLYDPAARSCGGRHGWLCDFIRACNPVQCLAEILWTINCQFQYTEPNKCRLISLFILIFAAKSTVVYRQLTLRKKCYNEVAPLHSLNFWYFLP